MPTETCSFDGSGQFRLAIGQSQQKEFTGNECIASFEGLFFGGLHQLDQFRPHLNLILTCDLWQPLHSRIGSRHQRCHIDASPLQQRFRAILLLQHGQQNVGWIDVSVIFAQGQGLSIAQRFLKLRGEFVNSHLNLLCASFWADQGIFQVLKSIESDKATLALK